MGIWPNRLANASHSLIRFINRFHPVAGFERIVRDYFAGSYKRAGAKLAMRFAHQLADRQPKSKQLMSFGRTMGLAPGGHLVRTIAITYNGMNYHLAPWSRIYPIAAKGQLLRSASLFDSPDRFRWVFDGNRTGMSKQAIVSSIRRSFSDLLLPSHRHPNLRRWLNRMDRIVLVI